MTILFKKQLIMTGGNSVLYKHELNHQVDEGEFDIRIKEGAVRFESNLNARVRMNVLSCVSGFDEQTELDFLDYLYYHCLFDKFIEFIAPEFKHLENYIYDNQLFDVRNHIPHSIRRCI